MKHTDRALIDARRRDVSDLWLQGMPVLRIAATLNIPQRTCRRDVAAVRAQIAAEQKEDLEARRDRAVSVLRKVQLAAWETYHTAQDKSLNKIGALNTIISAEKDIARLLGISGPDIAQNVTLTMLSSPEWQQVTATLLSALLPFPQARAAASDALLLLEEGGHDGNRP